MKIIFLDFDGVMIPSRCYWNPEPLWKMDPLAVDAINRLCYKTGSKIVFNTTWNRAIRSDEKSSFNHAINNGVLSCYIHTDYRTDYPEAESRTIAVQKWLAEHTEVTHYVVLDDYPVNLKNTILVHPDDGITIDVYRRASSILDAPESEKRMLVLM